MPPSEMNEVRRNAFRAHRNSAGYVLILIMCVTAELIIANRSALALSRYEEIPLDLYQAAFPDKNTSIRISGGEAVLEKDVLEFDEIDREVRTIRVETKNGNYCYIDLKIGFTDDNFALGGAYENNSSTHRIYLDKTENISCINVMPYGKMRKLRLEFCGGSGDVFTISSIKLNAAPPFRFSIIRSSFLALFCMLVKMKAWRWRSGSSNIGYLMFVSLMICAMPGLVTNMQSKVSGEPLLEPYPLENRYTRDQYQQLFSAFFEGKLDINAQPPPDELSSLECPYDITERDAADVSGDHWDRAYYNGRFYSYFGIAPVFTVYLPVYLRGIALK